jgi:serine/threonine protein phosphatase PrpC
MESGGMWRYALATDSYRPNSEDRAAEFPSPFGALAVVADGVGGRSGGAAAADAVVGAVTQLVAGLQHPPNSLQLKHWLQTLDREMAASGTVGETTAIVVAFHKGGISGASVGDSAALAFSPTACLDLTCGGGGPKPWVGSGACLPVAIAGPAGDPVVLATDGLVKYATEPEIERLVRSTPLDDAPRALIELVRYPSGRLPDDVAVIVARWDRNETGG